MTYLYKLNKNITKYLLIALLVIFGLFIITDSISKLGMFEGMQSKKEGMDDKKKEGMDDKKKEGMDDKKKEGMDDKKKEGMDDKKKEGMDDKKKEGMDDKKKEGLEEKQRKKTTNQITPFEESSTKSFTEY